MVTVVLTVQTHCIIELLGYYLLVLTASAATLSQRHLLYSTEQHVHTYYTDSSNVTIYSKYTVSALTSCPIHVNTCSLMISLAKNRIGLSDITSSEYKGAPSGR
jgi:hypothetical protein